MNYWIVKANPAYKGNTDFAEKFQNGQIHEWEATRIIKGFSARDKVIFWQSGRALRVIGLGEVVNPHFEKDFHIETHN
jgi:predicted RNA-binding protein with PUA-like domain